MNRLGLILFLVCGLLIFTMPVLAQEPPVQSPPIATPAEEEETDIVAGKVTAVDAVGNAITVTDEAGKSFTVTATKEETSIWKGDNTVEISEVKIDDSVELEYYKGKDGKLVAIWIDILAKEAVAPQEINPEGAAAPQEPAAPASAPTTAPAE